jgi:hypothetical protein
MALTRSPSNHAAQNSVTGTISNGVTWYETVILTDQDGVQLTGVDADIWQLQLRCDERSDTTDLVLSTSDGTLTITEGAEQTTMLIDCAQSRLDSLEGDYVIDIVSKDSDGRLTHRAHGVITIQESPVAF